MRDLRDLSEAELRELEAKGEIFVSWRNDIHYSDEYHKQMREQAEKKKKETIEKANSIYKEFMQSNPTPINYNSDNPHDTIKKNVGEIFKQKEEEQKKEMLLEAERQKTREELKSKLLNLFCTLVVPFLIMGLIALIAVYIL